MHLSKEPTRTEEVGVEADHRPEGHQGEERLQGDQGDDQRPVKGRHSGGEKKQRTDQVEVEEEVAEKGGEEEGRDEALVGGRQVAQPPHQPSAR